MKMKIIYDESVNIENVKNDKVIISMSYKEYEELRQSLIKEEKSGLEWYNILLKARALAEIEWK